MSFKKKKNYLIEKQPLIYAVKNKSEQTRASSTSGGIFTAASDYILDNNGVVYGVKFDEDFNVLHDKAFSKKERDKFRGSKYVQSYLGDIFSEIVDQLQGDQKVLFSGTPCQVAGLLSFLTKKKINSENLLTVDIVCHGVPSPMIWQNHISKLLHKYSSFFDYNFRDKRVGWRGANVSIGIKNKGYQINSPVLLSFVRLYFRSFITRPCCHKCQYTSINRHSDITIGDFWGIEKSMPEFDDNKGVSLVLVNSEKGNSFFQNISPCLIIKESNKTDCLQPQLQYPTKPSIRRSDFWRDYNKYGYDYICRKYAGCSFIGYLKYNLKKVKILKHVYHLLMGLKKK